MNPTVSQTQNLNRLAAETSPYLLQHKDNPVAWWPWGPEAFAEAKASGKPVLLSIGYAACHWCHVMAHESFENPQTAALMNSLFVNIKVDREEHPDVDQLYMAALQQLGQSGGWPLTMFLDADGQPFWGGTYFPPEPRYGRPAFSHVLNQVAAVYREAPDKVRGNTQSILSRLQAAAAPQAAVEIGAEDLSGAAERIAQRFDSENGGLQGAPKFPQAGLLEFLWRRGTRARDAELKAVVALSLNRMCEGGIYDHLGGGFARYSVDAVWLVPHFEKMLYDNAQLIEMLALAHGDTGDMLFLRRVREIVGWLKREMMSPEGAFAASLDADSEGHEGRFYVWTPQEIEAVLGPDDAAFFARFYDVTPQGNWEGHTILNRSSAGPVSEEEEARLEPLRARLLEARAHRVRPGRDGKVLADWNGLMIAALARAGAYLGESEWVELADAAFTTVCREMTPGGRLAHSLCDGKLVGPALACDLAAMARAGLALHEATGRQDPLERAHQWLDLLELHHREDASGGYFLTADDGDRLVMRPLSTYDEAVPNWNGVAADALLRLAALTGDDNLRTRADRILVGLSGAVNRNVLAHGALLNAIDTRLGLAEITTFGARGEELAQAALRVPFPLRVIARARASSDLPAGSLAAARAATAPAEGAAFICVGEQCSLPISDPGELVPTITSLISQ